MILIMLGITENRVFIIDKMKGKGSRYASQWLKTFASREENQSLGSSTCMPVHNYNTQK